jgi:hypothetical protein
VTLLLLSLTGTAVRPKHLGLFVLWTIPFALPFVLVVAQDPGNFFTGYIGGKLETSANPFTTLALNFWHAMTAFNVRGDNVFRSNPQSLPHLDRVSGILWLIGIVFWLGRGRRHLSPAIFVPFVVTQVPSMLVLSFPGEVPSASRTIAAAPLLYLLAASGLWWIAAGIRRAVARWPRAGASTAVLVVVAVLALVTTLNLQRYWGPYVAGLPDDNTPFGRIIAGYIDALPSGTTTYVVGCCWGAGNQPEPKGIQFSLRTTHTVRFIDTDKITCEELRSAPQPAVVIWGPNYTLPAPQLAGCARMLAARLHIANDKKVFYVSPITGS